MTPAEPTRARKAAPKKRRKVPAKRKSPQVRKNRPKVDTPAPVRSRAKALPVTELVAPEKPPEESRASIDWLSVRLRYVRGFIPENAPNSTPIKWESLNDIASALGISLRAVEAHCSEGGWVAERADFQEKLGARLKEETTRYLTIRQARARETIHVGAELLARKVIEKAQREAVSMSDLVGGITGLHRALKTTSEAADPSAGKVMVGMVGDVRWQLLRAGADPVDDADVLDVIPEEDGLD